MEGEECGGAVASVNSPPEIQTRPRRILFVYWGRRGLSRFSLALARAALTFPDLEPTFSISRQNEDFEAFSKLPLTLLPVNTFSRNIGSLTNAWRIPLLWKSVGDYISRNKIDAVIELMPHVWSSLLLPRLGSKARFATIVHDADSHPGDYRSTAVHFVLNQSVKHADLVLTLSEAVAGRIVARGLAPRPKVFTIFHPDLDFTPPRPRIAPKLGEPLRLAFLGRIMTYKGLPLFLETIQLLREEGLQIEFGVFGEGQLGPEKARIEAMGGDLINRWLTEQEISSILKHYHALVLSHIEASQSGIAASAFGAGLPVVATPVGGLIEQVLNGQNGIIALRADAPAIGEAVKTLLLDPQLYNAISANLVETMNERSMRRFLQDCVSLVHHAEKRY